MMTQTELLNEIQGCKVQDKDDTIYTVVDVRFFNGIVSTIGLESPSGKVIYTGADRYLEMADIGWVQNYSPSKVNYSVGGQSSLSNCFSVIRLLLGLFHWPSNLFWLWQPQHLQFNHHPGRNLILKDVTGQKILTMLIRSPKHGERIVSSGVFLLMVMQLHGSKLNF